MDTNRDDMPPSRGKCPYCTSYLPSGAKICTVCNRHKKWYVNHLRVDHLGILLTFVMMSIAYYNLEETRQKRVEATAALERVERAEVMVAELQSVLRKAQSNLDFNMLLTKASNDDRTAFDRLREIAQKPGSFGDIAHIVVNRIANDIVTLGYMEYVFSWKNYNIDPKKLSLQEFRDLYKLVPRFNKRAYLDLLMAQDRFPMFDRLQILAEVIRDTTSLQELERACRNMDNEAKLNKNILAVNEYLQWWEQNKSSYESAAK